MDQFAEQLSRLADLGEDELPQLETSLVAAFDAADSEGDVTTMTAAAEAIEKVREEKDRRGAGTEVPVENTDPTVTASAATAEAEPETATTTETAPVPEPVAETETSEVVETPAEEPAPVAETPAPVETTPATPTDEAAPAESQPAAPAVEEETMELDATDVVDEHKPEEVESTTVIRAGGDIPGITAGAELPDMGAVVDAMTVKVNSMRNLTGGNGEQVVVASLQSSAMDSRPELTLIPGDPDGNAKKIRAVTSDPEALTAAANGWCAPRTPRYEVYGVGSTDRPVRDSLPGFNADRGGIIFPEPPTLRYPTDDGIGIWEFVDDAWEAEDVPGGTTHADTKVIFEVECGEEGTADLYAITTQLKFTNMLARAFPEWVRRNTELAMIAQARTADTVLLTKMFATATDVPLDPSPSLGAARDTLVSFALIGESYRNRHRMGASERIDVWAPAWLLTAMALDLMLQSPGDKITDAKAEANGYLQDAGVDVTWFIDDVIGDNQLITAKAALPATASVLFASKGTFLGLNGGTLDLGVVRDATLVGQNKYIEFAETFEGVANIGVEALRTDLPVGLIGGTAAPIDTSDGYAVAAAS